MKRAETEMLATTSIPTGRTDIGGYEPPEMVEIASATTLLRGIVMTKNYYDCLSDSTTDYQPRC